MLYTHTISPLGPPTPTCPWMPAAEEHRHAAVRTSSWGPKVAPKTLAWGMGISTEIPLGNQTPYLNIL